ncbi:DUF4365 domain-containing protein [Caulobacter vibrioides]|nr:DUF4365 domain-containing protein [Caulobacter vibrioides]
MANRPRSHQLEDLSRNRFRALVPLHWVVRDRSHDYGVGFEVEVFSPDGEATGLIFLAQLKATDSADAADRLTLPNEKLAYLCGLDLPVALFRYSSPDDSWRWAWVFDANVYNAQGGVKTATIRFGLEHAWCDQTLADLERTLRVGRALKNAYPQQRVALVRAGPIAPVRRQFAVDDAIAAIINEVPCLTGDRKAVDDLIIDVEDHALGLRMRLDRYASVEIAEPDPSALKGELLYSLVTMLRGLGLHVQAEVAARAVLRQNLTTMERSLAARAVAALASDPMAACELAISNGIHQQQDPSWAMAYHLLVKARAPKAVSAQAAQWFCRETLAHARATGKPEREALVRNNLANLLIGLGGHEREALHHLNAARRLRPAYMRADYFLVDIGRTLFNAGRYRGAALFYRAAYERKHDRGVRLFLADALMFAGLVGEARDHFRALQEDMEEGEGAEIGLKAILCEIIELEFSSPVVPARKAAGDARASALVGDDLNDPILLRELIVSHDVFNLVANFNLGLTSSKAGNVENAVKHFLICAFKRSGDIEAWRNAVLLSISLQDPLVATAIIDCAMRMGGLAVREAVRLELIDQVDSEAAIQALDLAMTTALELAGKKERGVLFRLHDSEGKRRMLTFSLG